MNNADMPAMPSLIEWQADFRSGLTKREHFAGLAMQGLGVNMGRNGIVNIEKLAVAAVEAADALLAKLDKVQK
jgi:hypothetical protein